MATLSEVVSRFLDGADECDAAALGNEVRRLANDSVRCIGDFTCGEIAAIVQRCGTAMAWIVAEQRDPDSRQHRHGRQRALLDLLDLCEAIRTFHAGKGDDDHLSAMRVEIADALRPLVNAADA